MLAGSSELDLDEGSISSNVLESQPDPASLVCPVVHDVDRDRVSWLALNKPVKKQKANTCTVSQ